MRWLNKLSNRREPSGMEWRILTRLPACLVGSIAIPLLTAFGGRFLSLDGTRDEVAKQLMTLDIFAFAVGLTAVTAVFTIAIGCIVVIVMKGPAYVADSFSPDDPKYRDRN